MSNKLALMTDSSDQEGEYLFQLQAKNENVKKCEVDNSDEEHPKRSKKSKPKSNKKHKKKRLRRIASDDEEEEDERSDNGIRGLIEDEASEDSQEESEIGSNDEENEIEKQEPAKYKALYKVNDNQATDDFLKKFEGRRDEDVNNYYKRKASKGKFSQLPFEKSECKLFSVPCYKNYEDQLVINILNKASYLSTHKDTQYKCTISSVFCSKKKYPGKLFIEATKQSEVKESLSNFQASGVNLNRIKEEGKEIYACLFAEKMKNKSAFEEGQFVKVKNNVYKGDLGKIHKVNRNKISVILMPRVNLRLIANLLRNVEALDLNEKGVLDKKNEVFKKYTDHKTFYQPSERPPKGLIFLESLEQFRSLPYMKKIAITESGMMVISFALHEVQKPIGTILPIELQPFSKSGDIYKEFQNEGETKIFIGMTLYKGQMVQIIAGELKGLYGRVTESDSTQVVFQSLHPQLKGVKITELIEHIDKRFADKDNVVIVDGNKRGVEGMVLTQQGSYVNIWTNSNYELKALKRNVTLKQNIMITEVNEFDHKLYNIIKTTNGTIGIIVISEKDFVKILTTTNSLLTVSNLDIASKITNKNAVAKSKNAEIKRESIVRIANGERANKICEVKSIYQNFLFLFNKEFSKTCNLCVENVSNCRIMADCTYNSTYRRDLIKNKRAQDNDDGEFKVGMSFLLRAGPLKGYRGIIRTVEKDKIEVAVPQKNYSQWISKIGEKKVEESFAHEVNHIPNDFRTPLPGFRSMTGIYSSNAFDD